MRLIGEDLQTLLATQRGRVRFLVRFGAGGAAAIAAWTWLGAFLLAQPLVAAATLPLVAAYGAALAIAAGLAVRENDRWQVESASQARRLLTTGKKIVEAAPAEELGFQQLYFLHRLEDEIRHSRQHGTPLSVVTLRVSRREGSTAEAERITLEVAGLLATYSQIESPSVISPFEYAFFLRHTDRRMSAVFTGTLLKALGDFWCDGGVAMYPEDGTDARSLLESARRQYVRETGGPMRPQETRGALTSALERRTG